MPSCRSSPGESLSTPTSELVPSRLRRQCSSGLQAIASVAASIKAGFYAIGIAGGVETMSTNGMTWDGGVNPGVKDFPQVRAVRD